MHSPLLIRSGWLVVGLACAGGLGEAQGKGVLGQENADFARKLFDEGYRDLAESLCKTIEANAPAALEQLAVTTLGFELRFDQAKRENDPQKRAQGLRQTIQDENTFLKDNSRTRAAEDVRANLPNVYIELATTLQAALKQDTADAEKRATLLQEAVTVLTEAKDTLTKRIEEVQKRLAAQTGNPEYNERQLEVARYNLAKLNFHFASIYPDGAPERKPLLEESLKGFGDYGFDYPDSPQNYRGVIYQGLCHEALGKLDDAARDYRDAIALREQFDTDGNGVFLVGPENADIISGAALQLVKLLTKMNREREAVAIANDYLKRTPDALAANKGPEILAAKAEAEIHGGDIAGASATAQMLQELDPQGWAGRTGRELLGRLPIFGLAPDKILKIAETAASRGDFLRALDLARQAREMVHGARDEQDVGSAALNLTGFVYRSQGRMHEATEGYDLAAELYPKGKDAPEALYSAVTLYRQLATKEKSGFYANRADQRMNTLATKYPESPRAASAGIYQGQRKEDKGDFEGARDFYSKIPKDSPSYFEAQYRLASATNQQGRNLLKDKPADAQALLATAEKEYENAMSVIQAAQAETLDPAVQAKLAGFLISCRLGLGTLYLDTNKADKVAKQLEGLEQKITDADVVASIWSLRIRALQAQGKVDEAVKLFESLLQTSASSPAIGSAAGILARALDASAQDLFSKDPQAKRAGELWRKASYYYSLSVKGALDGTAPLRGEDVKEVAQRLYVIGLFFNAVPEGQYTFVDWQGTVAEPDLWDEAARIYEKLDAQAPSTEIAIAHARTLAILGKVKEAEAIYARLFDQVSLFATGDTSNRFDRAVVEARPELITAYLEWGVASHVVGIATKEDALVERADTIYKRMIANTTDSSRLWWQTRFSQIRLLSDRGQYPFAKTAIESLKRNTDPEYDKGQYGFKDKFIEMEKELSKKVF
jgi:tetratricopeptide (TPR) repeat protein